MEANLLLILEDAIDLVFSHFDCRRSTCLSPTGLAFAVAEIDFPSPTSAIHQLNDRIFHSLVFHRIYFAQRLRGPRWPAHWLALNNTPNEYPRMFTCVLNEFEFFDQRPCPSGARRAARNPPFTDDTEAGCAFRLRCGGRVS